MRAPSPLRQAALGLLLASAAVAQGGFASVRVFGPTTDSVDLVHAPGDPSRVFIVFLDGYVRVAVDEVVEPVPFLDLSALVDLAGERGLLGMAFHPDYASNGRFFIDYVDLNGVTHVAEYRVSPDPNVADPNPVQDIVTIQQVNAHHQGGKIRFGPDGKLYVATGDSGDRLAAQDGMSFFGKILRFDVDLPAPFIPADNPFVGVPTTRDEVWHLGLRNPWTFHFDRLTGDLWIADVGEADREEINFVPSGVGGLNFGWPCMEGSSCTTSGGCVCNAAELTLPIHEYAHTGHCAISGGIVYRGNALPSLQGAYFFSDLCSGTIWSLRYDGTAVTELIDRTAAFWPTTGSFGSIVGVADDHAGEMYVIQLNSRIYKVVPDCGWENYCAAVPNSTGTIGALSASGATSLAGNQFTVHCSGLPPTSVGIFFYGPQQVSVASGAGRLCVSGNASMPAIRLYPALVADANGFLSRPIDLSAPPITSGPGAVVPGVTVNFQFWYRDLVAGAPTWNFSDGLEVQFCP